MQGFIQPALLLQSAEEDGVLDWPIDLPLGRKLDKLQDDLLCPICQSLYVNPHILKCGHSFCSLCIRKHCDATYNRTSHELCPCCREKADLIDLRKNVSLASIIDKYREFSNDLLVLLTNKPSDIDQELVKEKNKKKVRMVTPGKLPPARLAQYNFHGMSKEAVKRAIDDVCRNSQVKLRLDGDKDALERRLRELIHLLNAQSGQREELVLTLDECIERINAQDKLRKLVGGGGGSKGAGIKENEDLFQSLAKKALQSRQKVPPPASSSASSGAITSSSTCPWRLGYSTKLDKVFYFNVDTKLGSFRRPEDYEPPCWEELLPALPEESQEEEADDVVDVPTEDLATQPPELEKEAMLDPENDLEHHYLPVSTQEQQVSSSPSLSASGVIGADNVKDNTLVQSTGEVQTVRDFLDIDDHSPEVSKVNDEEVLLIEAEQSPVLPLSSTPHTNTHAYQKYYNESPIIPSPPLTASSQPVTTGSSSSSAMPPAESAAANCWTCPACTYINPINTTTPGINYQLLPAPVCEMCDTPNPHWTGRVTRSHHRGHVGGVGTWVALAGGASTSRNSHSQRSDGGTGITGHTRKKQRKSH